MEAHKRRTGNPYVLLEEEADGTALENGRKDQAQEKRRPKERQDGKTKRKASQGSDVARRGRVAYDSEGEAATQEDPGSTEQNGTNGKGSGKGRRKQATTVQNRDVGRKMSRTNSNHPIVSGRDQLERVPAVKWKEFDARRIPSQLSVDSALRAKFSRNLVSQDDTKDVPLSLKVYLESELSIHKSVYEMAPDSTWGISERERVYNTLLFVPYQLEKLLIFGSGLCLDAFLFLFTFLPLRLLGIIVRRLPFFNSKKGKHIRSEELSDMLWMSLFGLGVYFLCLQNIGSIYHYIRGQEVLKLYVVFNVLEIFDKICSSFGADTFEAMSGTVSSLTAHFKPGAEKNRKAIMADAFCLVGDYTIAAGVVLLQSMVILCEAITLNVAVNSASNTLLAMLISNNFVEIKGSVFKKMDVNKLFVMTCQDMVERFHIFTCILFIAVENILHRPDDLRLDAHLAVQLASIMMCEVLVDVLKHSFLGKFNEIKPGVYGEYLRDLCVRTTRTRSYKVHRVVSFEPIAPACVLVRILIPLGLAIKLRMGLGGWIGHVLFGLLLASFFLFLVAAKILLGFSIHWISRAFMASYEKTQSQRKAKLQ